MSGKILFKNKLFKVYKFINPYGNKYIGMEFLVPTSSDPKYRGLPDTREARKKLAKMFRDAARNLGKAAIVLCLFGTVAKADMIWRVYVSTDQTGQTQPSETVISTGAYQVPLPGASMRCGVSPVENHPVAPQITLAVRALSCEFVEGSAAAVIGGCVLEESDGQLNQLLLVNLNRYYQISVGCANTVNSKK